LFELQKEWIVVMRHQKRDPTECADAADAGDFYRRVDEVVMVE
jgi:hypothetical protein